MSVEIRRASHRFLERGPGRATHHSFSFGEHYDPLRLTFGPMVCHDDHRLSEGAGFDEHRHSGLDIVSWVLSGALRHTDADAADSAVESGSGSVVVEPGSAAVLRSGSGVSHSEVAAAPQTRFVQVWLRPPPDAEPVRTPSYDVTPVDQVPGELVVAAELPGATFRVARLGAGDTLTLPESPLLHVYVARGALMRSSLAEPLLDGDAFEMRAEPAHRITAAVPTELLVWSFDE